MKYRSQSKNGFTNRGCLHCAIFKALHGFIKKEPTSQGFFEFLLQNVQNKIFKIMKMIKTSLKLTTADL